VKAAVIHEFGAVPRYEDFADPTLDAGDLLVHVQAVALENFDKMTAQGVHYSSREIFPMFPAIVGHSGVGALSDGKLVFFGGTKPPYGTLAEKAVVPKAYAAYASPVPEGVDLAVAAALPASALTSLLPLRWGVKLEPGQTVLIQGATGVSGKLAVQIAKLLGAGKIVGTGREDSILRSLSDLGATATIDLKQPDTAIIEAFTREAGQGYDVILDFLWGHPTELLFRALTPTEAGFAKRRTRYVQSGQAAGPTITLLAEALRTSGLEIGGGGNVSPAVLPEALQQVWAWFGQGLLTCNVEKMHLKDIAEAWNRKASGKRIVIVP
jgi:NADPH:quinone reductase-like Zn-dependent oxidoreductase